MKKILFFLVLLCLLLTACKGPSFTIDYDNVEKAVVWSHQSEYQLTEDETSKVIEEYNKSKYGGRATGEGGTPDFGLSIFFEDGQEAWVNDFSSGVMEVYHNKKVFYLENENLYYLIKKLSGL
jgi:hypothetical protein